jgi:hypothetical protein
MFIIDVTITLNRNIFLCIIIVRLLLSKVFREMGSVEGFWLSRNAVKRHVKYVNQCTIIVSLRWSEARKFVLWV